MGNLYLTPYLEMYRNIVGDSFDIIYWDRENKNEHIKCNSAYRFKYDIKNISIFKKIVGYIKYRSFIKKIIKHSKYDRVVLLQTWASLLLYGIINRLYKDRYIVDIRDYTYENNILIRTIEKKVLKCAEMRLVSSEGFKHFLPDEVNYHVVHNIRNLREEERLAIINRSHSSKPIRISFIGFVNYMEINKQLIQALGNDDRFHLNFIGTNALKLKEYCEANKIGNVTLIDTFKPEEILRFYQETDIVNNLYGHNDPRLDYALSNKLYFAVQLKMPILVFTNTYMAEVSKAYNLGIEIDELNRDLGDRIYHKYMNIDWNELSTECDKLLIKIQKEQSETIQSLTKSML